VPRLNESTRSARRSQIIAAAVDCFARAGYHATTMADVAAEAGVSKGTPYLYFASKEDLFIALHDEWGCRLSERIDATVAALPDADRRSPRRTLRAVASAIGAHVIDQPATCRVLMEARSLATYNPTIAAAVLTGDDRNHTGLEDLIRAGVAAGEWPRGTNPALAARLFLATVYGLMAQWHLAPDSFSWDDAATALATET
jgi:AcrR family transcriptional regulator